MVQGGMEGCPLGKALWTTQGRKARNALLQTIKACKLKNTCYCERDDREREEGTNIAKEENGATCWKTQES